MLIGVGGGGRCCFEVVLTQDHSSFSHAIGVCKNRGLGGGGQENFTLSQGGGTKSL